MKLDVNDIVFREITIEDASEYLSFAKEILLEDNYSVTDPDEFKINVAEEKTWIENIKSNPNNIFLLAIYNDKIVGSVSIIQNIGKKISHTAELSVQVSKEYRDNKIGRYLLQYSLQKIKDNSPVQKIILYVLESNERAIHLYRNFNFKQEGTLIKHVRMRNGDFENLVIMSVENVF